MTFKSLRIRKPLFAWKVRVVFLRQHNLHQSNNNSN